MTKRNAKKKDERGEKKDAAKKHGKKKDPKHKSKGKGKKSTPKKKDANGKHGKSKEKQAKPARQTCPCCSKHCPLAKPRCSKGRRLAEKLKA